MKIIFDLISGKIRQIALPSNSQFSSLHDWIVFLFLSLSFSAESWLNSYEKSIFQII